MSKQTWEEALKLKSNKNKEMIFKEGEFTITIMFGRWKWIELTSKWKKEIIAFSTEFIKPKTASEILWKAIENEKDKQWIITEAKEKQWIITEVKEKDNG